MVRRVRTSVEPSLVATDYPFSHRIRVRFAETDAMGIVHHSRYLPMMEEARVAYLRHIGHPYQEIRDEGIEMNVLEAWVRYRMPLVFDDVVDVHVQLAAVERASFQMGYLLTVTGEVRATGITAHGAVTTAGRPTRLPAWLRDLG
jgi:acyl-CoA thioester hydrolase